MKETRYVHWGGDQSMRGEEGAMLKLGVARGARRAAPAFRAMSTGGKGLAEFFDGSANATEGSYQTGRAWHASELRNKSFDDLHKLWFVCWKETNKLKTERQIAKTLGTELANPERMGKVKKTMARIQTVLSERRILHQKEKSVAELRELLRAELIKERERARIDVLIEQARKDPSIDLEALKEEYLKEEYAKALEERAARKGERIKEAEEAEKHRKYLNDLKGIETVPKLPEYRRVVQMNKGNFTKPRAKPFFKKSER